MNEAGKSEQFQYWLSAMDEALTEFKDSVPSGVRDGFDLSPDSLERLERLLLDKSKNPDQTKSSGEAKFLDGAARYFGEVLRLGTESEWQIRLDDKNSVFYGLPILFGGKIRAVAICPLTSVTSCTDRRVGNYLHKIFKNMTNA